MFDMAAVRARFPALQRTVDGRMPIFLDGPGGTQVPQAVLDAMTHYLATTNANHGGVFPTSRLSDALIRERTSPAPTCSTRRRRRKSFSVRT